VEHAGGKANGKATGLYNKHRKYSEQWNPSHQFRSLHEFPQAQSFRQQTKTWIDHHLSRGLGIFKIKLFQSSDAMRKLLSELDFGLGNDSWIEHDPHIFGILCYKDIFKSIQVLLEHFAFEAHFDFDLVLLADSEGHPI
jgi:hypothetical protein